MNRPSSLSLAATFVCALATVTACSEDDGKGGDGAIAPGEGEGEAPESEGAEGEASGAGTDAGGASGSAAGDPDDDPQGGGEIGGEGEGEGEDGGEGGQVPIEAPGVVSNPDFKEGGEPCADAGECRSSRCVDGRCDEPLCDARADANECGGGRVCSALVADDRCWSVCHGEADCDPEFWCQRVSPNMGRCWPRGRGDAEEPCASSADCDSGLCDRGACAARCDGEAGAAGACGDGRACVKLRQGDVCRTIGPAAAGAHCQQHGDCETGYCWRNRCQRTCGSGQACGGEHVCRDVGTARICVPACGPDLACPQDNACQPFFEGFGCQPMGGLGPMEPCNQDHQCASAVCTQGQCAPPCDDDVIGGAGCEDEMWSCVAHALGRVCLHSGPAETRQPADRGHQCQSGVTTSGGRCTPSCETSAECGEAYACILAPSSVRFGGRPIAYCERTCDADDECPDNSDDVTFCDHRTDRDGAPVATCSRRGWGALGDLCLANIDCHSGRCVGATCAGPDSPSLGPGPGDPCYGPGSCASGRCEDGYCAAACEAGECGQGQICLPGADQCKPACATDGDCKGGGFCRPSEAQPPHCVR